MPRVKHVIVYDIDELSECAKEKAISDLSINLDYFSGDDNVNTLDAFDDMFPIQVRDWEYSYCRSGSIHFWFTGGDEVRELSGHRLAKYIWNNYHATLFPGKYYSTHNGNKTFSYHSKVTVEPGYALTGYYMDDAILKPIYEFLSKPDSRDFYDLMHDCLNEWLSACTKDLEYHHSEEYLTEHAIANNLGFDQYGNLI